LASPSPEDIKLKIRGSRRSAIVAGSACVLCAGAGVAQSDVQQGAPQLKI